MTGLTGPHHLTRREQRPGHLLKAPARAVLACLAANGEAALPALFAAMGAAGDTRPAKNQSTTVSNLQTQGYVTRRNVNQVPHWLLTELGQRAVAATSVDVEVSPRHKRRLATASKPAQPTAAPMAAPVVVQVPVANDPQDSGQWVRYGSGQVRVPPMHLRSVFDLGAAP